MGENIVDYSNKHPVGGLNVDYFLEHAEEIINDTEHLSNPYDFGVLLLMMIVLYAIIIMN